MKEKKSYLALIYDFKRIPKYREYKEESVDRYGNKISKPKKKFLHYVKNFSNERWGLYCSCGHRTDFDKDYIYRGQKNLIEFMLPLICGGCNKKYNSFYEDELIMIYSKDPALNAISRRFSIVEKDKFYALYSFYTTVFVSITTKKLIFKDVIGKPLYFSKINDTIKVKNKEKLITVPLKSLVKICSSVLNQAMDNVLDERIISQGLFERQVITPLINFSKIIESKCDKRDVEKINLILEKEREDVYFNSFFKNCPTYYHQNFFDFECYYNTEYIFRYSDTVSIIRYIWIQYLKRRINIMLAISIYPPLATLVITYGPDKFLRLFSETTLMCSFTNLKRKKPTNPREILEVLFKSKVNLEFAKNKRILKYIVTEERKRKRKLKKNPDSISLLPSIESHPTEWVDSRVPIFEGVKKELKKLNFRKFYADLFIENNFDEMAKLFYGVLKKDMIFDNIETLDNIILKNNTEKINLILTILNRSYGNYKLRIGDFKLNQHSFNHLMKLSKDGSDYQYKNLDWICELYFDCVYLCRNLNISNSEIFKVKNLDSLRGLHNTLSNSYQISIDKNKLEKLTNHVNRFRHTEGVFDDIKFSLLDTPERFYEESSVMNHCVKTYCQNTSEGLYVIYSIEDLNTGHRATLSINSKNNVFSFNQLKSKNNSKATEKIINSVKNHIALFFEIKENSNRDLFLETQNIPFEEIVLRQNNNAVQQLEFNNLLDDNLPF